MKIIKKLFSKYKNDMVSDLTTATIALPQNMAYALILGINPIYGIYASLFSKRKFNRIDFLNLV